MARLQIGGGNTRVGEVYLDMLFRQRALDNARAEAAQRASIESARLQAGERNAEREAQMQMLQMQQQANLAREARAASQAENQAQRQFSAEQQAASLGWDKEKLAKEIESRESMAAARDKSEELADKRRFTQQMAIAEKQDELAQRRNNLELIATIAQGDPSAKIEELEKMNPMQLASYAGQSVKKAKTAEEQKVLLDKYASAGMDIPELMSDSQRAAAAVVQVDRQRQEAREDKAKAEAKQDAFALKRADARMRHAEALADLLVKSQVKDEMGGIMFNSELFNKGKEELDAGFQGAIQGLSKEPEAAVTPAATVKPSFNASTPIPLSPVQQRDIGSAYSKYRTATGPQRTVMERALESLGPAGLVASSQLYGYGATGGTSPTADTELLRTIGTGSPDLERAAQLQLLENYRLQRAKESRATPLGYLSTMFEPDAPLYQ